MSLEFRAGQEGRTSLGGSDAEGRVGSGEARRVRRAARTFSGYGFWVLGFGFGVLGFGFWFLSLGLRV